MNDLRQFRTVPRVMICANPTRGVVFFHTSDNPMKIAREMIRQLATAPESLKLERFYGVANRLVSARLAAFDPAVHVIPSARWPWKSMYDHLEIGRRQHQEAAATHDAGQSPAAATKPEEPRFCMYHYVDPCDGRAFFQLWIAVDERNRDFVAYEWPNQRHPVPRIGMIGPWATTSGSRLDGARGPGQQSLAWGLAQYKQEIARIEGWEDYKPDATIEEIKAWNQFGKKKWPVISRYLDARFANAENLNEGGTISLFDAFDEIGLTFDETSGRSGHKDEIADGVQLINDALAFNSEQPVVDVINAPRLYLHEWCENLTFAARVWTGNDGNKGATKDPIDCLRHHKLKGNVFVDAKSTGGSPGMGCY